LGSTPNAARIDRRISSRRRATRDGRVVRSSCASCPPDRISAADRRRGFGLTVERRAPIVRWLSDAERRAATQPASIKADLPARSSRPAARLTAATSRRQRLALRRSSRAARRHPNQRIRRATSQSSSNRTARRNPTHRVARTISHSSTLRARRRLTSRQMKRRKTIPHPTHPDRRCAARRVSARFSG
jgi:hypothetical protein